MIDYEVQIFNKIYPHVAPLCASNKFVSTLIVSPTAFPTASLIEMDNATVRQRQSSTPIENYAVITYQLDVYANSKSKCREVFNAADDAMIAIGFNRFSGQFIPNAENTKVFRYTARYEAEIDQDGVIYRRR